MSLAVVNTSTSFSAGATPTSVSGAFTLTTGNTVLVGLRIGINQLTVLSMTDTAGNAYRQLTGRATGASGLIVWYASNVIGNATNVITAVHNSAANCSFVIVQISGAVAFPIDVWAVSGTTTTTTPTTAAFTTVWPTDMLVVFGNQDTTGHAWSAASGYTLQGQDSQNFMGVATKTVSSIQSGATASIVSTDAVAVKVCVVVAVTATVNTLAPYAPGMVVVPDADSGTGLYGISFNSNSSAVVNQRMTLGAYEGAGSSEGGAQLQGGTFIVGAKNSFLGTTQAFQIYDHTFTQIGFSTALVGGNIFDPMASDYTSTFWVSKGHAGVVQVLSLTPGGIAGSPITLTDIINIRCMGVSQDNSTLYYADATTGHPIRRWDLVHNVALGVFVTPTSTNVWGQDLIVVPSTDTFVVIVQTDSAVESFTLNRYSTLTGALISSFPLAGPIDNFSDPRLSVDAGGPVEAIWIRTYPDVSGNTTTFVQMNLETGATIRSFTVPMSEGPNATGAAPLSCPFFAWSNNLVVNQFIGSKVTVPMVRKRRVPFPVLSADRLQFVHQVVAEIEKGQGVEGDVTTQARLQMKLSVDNGETWGTERSLSLGREGAYDGRVYANLWPYGRYPVLEVTVSDNTNAVLMDLQALVSEGDR